MYMNMRIVMYMNMYIEGIGKNLLKEYKKSGKSMSALVNALIIEHFTNIEGTKVEFWEAPLMMRKWYHYPNDDELAAAHELPPAKELAPIESLCCAGVKPCQHWNFDGEVWRNSISGRIREPL